ncbi:LLM class flavin-dependent oxidoreductase [Curtobacterium flaccumfaciens]|uniref:LLM class flavin-dependent oxidoreductase n=1 Tax=Curtobacterium flaccumfaciens TaxID=2035 RepID=UPI001BDED4C7|nr:LLM class flavin-dependent oxidoreductase [Curtobacterium flaccumfaciens]MBT1631564.1 LLM class flavin-dependent oxidoreductase [Curtobacterium flaccumfaciens pv. oortii]MCX2846872.1 LLM class flavin-dependent oxidoreductase [Curtobacterium flaccumfaciens pv. oortii]
MPTYGTPLERLGFLTIGSFDPSRPGDGHEETLRMVERGERLGFDAAWFRQRHLQYGISSPVAMLAAASQRTSRIRLGTAVTPIGAENPFRLAEDLSTVDLLLGGRLEAGFSAGPPAHFDLFRDALYPGTASHEDLGYERLLRFRDLVGGALVTQGNASSFNEGLANSVQPHSAGLVERLWYGAASTLSALWAGENGFHLLTSSVTRSEIGRNFGRNQRAQIDAYLSVHPNPLTARVSQGIVAIPTDSAKPEQKRRYRHYVDSRAARVGVPIGPSRILLAPDLLGTSTELAEQLHGDPGYQAATEVTFALPFKLQPTDYAQILNDLAEHLGPKLGWSPRSASPHRPEKTNRTAGGRR